MNHLLLYIGPLAWPENFQTCMTQIEGNTRFPTYDVTNMTFNATVCGKIKKFILNSVYYSNSEFIIFTTIPPNTESEHASFITMYFPVISSSNSIG